MIQIKDKHDCCGCSACQQRCPRHCITMREDSEGFFYPEVDTDACVDCGLCERVCPLANPGNPKHWMEVIGAKNRNEDELLGSSSGGVFINLARNVIAEGGIVFGAVFDGSWNVVHTYADSIDGVWAMMGSKYVQSDINDSYIKAERFLEDGRIVLFTGTPCQVAGLNRYLRKSYPNLLSVDFLCHGVPGPGVWHMYLDEIRRSAGGTTRPCEDTNRMVITGISFRDKRIYGWDKYCFVVRGSTAVTGESAVLMSDVYVDNPFMKGFLNDVYLRPSCYRCKCKGGVSGSDITLADYWGVKTLLPDFADNRGVSLVFVNTDKGKTAAERLDMDFCAANINGLERYNGGMKAVLREGWRRRTFFHELGDGRSFSAALNSALAKPWYNTALHGLRKAVRRIIFKLTNDEDRNIDASATH